MKKQVIFQDLGLQPYKKVWDYQESLLAKVIAAKRSKFLQTTNTQEEETNGKDENYLLFTEHFPVYTLGKNGNEANVLINETYRKEKGIEYYHINRGGDITFHGPEQIVGYPIFNLEMFKTDIGWYLRSLEEVIILTLKEYGLHGERSRGETGVWLAPGEKGNERKICAMGIRCSRWVTMHGFALNVNTALHYFDMIVPCGIQNKKVTSLEKETGKKIPLDEVKEKLKKNFEKVFEITFI